MCCNPETLGSLLVSGGKDIVVVMVRGWRLHLAYGRFSVNLNSMLSDVIFQDKKMEGRCLV